MKRILLWTMSTLTVLVLLFGYHTSTSSRYPVAAESAAVAPISGGAAGDAATTGGTAGSGSGAASGTGTGSGSGSVGGSTGTTTTGGSSSAATTVTGSVAQTRWGPVQVQLTVSQGRITDVAVLQYPHENGKDEQINDRALPILIDETLTAQSGNIDMVSGATVTSEGYLSSLQSALDRAGL